ncbi:AAA family ATPase [Kineococcus sp. TBRC 1896]|uniref:AAA family ATPase n=1 Tax=Kineococcus mangrovi TaxID=1660183 RepID=A0ABV4I7I3_9ACTN
MSALAALHRNDLQIHTLDDLYDLADRNPEWLVEGLLIHGPNLLIGKRNVGKSRFADHLAACALLGQPVGRVLPLESCIERVVLVTAESGGLSERARSFRAAGVPRGLGHLYAVAYPHGVGIDWWQNLADAVRADDRTLLIVDNLTRLVTGSLNDDGAVKPILNGLDVFQQRGCASVVLAHIKDGGTEGPEARAIGHSVMGQSFRQQATVTPGPQPGSIRLRSEGHTGLAAQDFTLQLGTEHGTDFQLDPASLRRERGPQRQATLEEAAAFYLDNDLEKLPTIGARAQALADGLGGTVGTWRNAIGGGRRGAAFQARLALAQGVARSA